MLHAKVVRGCYACAYIAAEPQLLQVPQALEGDGVNPLLDFRVEPHETPHTAENGKGQDFGGAPG